MNIGHYMTTGQIFYDFLPLYNVDVKKYL